MASKSGFSINTGSQNLFEINPSARCDELKSPSTTSFVISCGLIFWTIASYIPQYARIIRRQSAEGLSTLYILLGASSGVCAVANILVLPSSQVDMGCCRSNDTYPCIAGLLGMVQVINGVACFWGVMFLYIYYAREEAEAERTGRRPSMASQMRTYRRARKAWFVLFFVFAWALFILLISAIIMHRFPWYAQNWADFLGVLVAALACTQWLPQVFTTWHLGHLGSLSVAMLALSTPSTWIFGFSLISRVGFAGWSAWIVYVLVGTMQLILIGTAIFFAIRDYQHGEPGKNTIETGIQGNAWLDGYSISSEDGGDYEVDAESMIAPDERMSLLDGHDKKGKGTLAAFYGHDRGL
ncbi:hypothetical protein TWF225_005464 [Orbilia oligospora]|uniref:Uncharacterized protein n=1 Tax=Orbilia oligospora TaxID=2813651 RepID=A0A7C8PAP1_ORBOL|nr:hypothetical protein TWF751_006470 [Orbilia oligospora]KAF3194847.1 hypothetical protein TWF225_005464 [Orbilia oligospora]KAF3259905.1 hypothetical protein TWF128_003895 [Orbilia oligospora]KAF3270787.1 hypothetical protein TWF217_007062 [Orbilia oligospora]KAF3292272.1 hypothetical protein TWF132_005662 [Orbilia oligospora]